MRESFATALGVWAIFVLLLIVALSDNAHF